MNKLAAAEVAFLKVLEENHLHGGDQMLSWEIYKESRSNPAHPTRMYKAGRNLMRLFGKDRKPYQPRYAGKLHRGLGNLVSQGLVERELIPKPFNPDSKHKIAAFQLSERAILLKPEYLSLTGKMIPAIIAEPVNGHHILKQRPHAIEYGHYLRLESEVHPKWAGVAIVRGYSAEDQNVFEESAQAKVQLLEEAKRNDQRPYVFMISKSRDNSVLITSRMDMHINRLIQVAIDNTQERPSNTADKYDISMCELPVNFSENDLIRVHAQRAQDAQIDIAEPINSVDVNQIYTYIVAS
jgi:hypothetical protein